MIGKPKLSICITVYNQIELLKWNMDQIMQYKSNDIQIVVSDNCSSQPIKDLVEGYQDPRIKYCKTNYNHGQDGNIIWGLRNCDSDYVFLLRTRDTLVPSEIANIIASINNNPSGAYWRFSALNMNNSIRLRLKDKKYTSITEKKWANANLLVHPSGEMYNISLINQQEFDSINDLLAASFPNNNGYLAHTLIQYLLIEKGDIIASSAPVWIYADSGKASDKSINSENLSKRGISAYSPQLQYPRFQCEIKYISTYIKNAYVKKQLMANCTKKYSYLITYSFKFINGSEEMRDHYNCIQEDYSRRVERRKFVAYTHNNFDFCDKGTQRYLYIKAIAYTYFSFRTIWYLLNRMIASTRCLYRNLVKNNKKL